MGFGLINMKKDYLLLQFKKKKKTFAIWVEDSPCMLMASSVEDILNLSSHD